MSTILLLLLGLFIQNIVLGQEDGGEIDNGGEGTFNVTMTGIMTTESDMDPIFSEGNCNESNALNDIRNWKLEYDENFPDFDWSNNCDNSTYFLGFRINHISEYAWNNDTNSYQITDNSINLNSLNFTLDNNTSWEYINNEDEMDMYTMYQDCQVLLNRYTLLNYWDIDIDIDVTIENSTLGLNVTLNTSTIINDLNITIPPTEINITTLLYLEDCNVSIYNDEYMVYLPEYTLQLLINIKDWPFLQQGNYLLFNYELISGDDMIELTTTESPVPVTSVIETPITSIITTSVTQIINVTENIGGEGDNDGGEIVDNDDDIITPSFHDDLGIIEANATDSLLSEDIGSVYNFNNKIFQLDLLNLVLLDANSSVDLLNLTFDENLLEDEEVNVDDDENNNNNVDITMIFPQFDRILEYTSFISIRNIQKSSDIITTPSTTIQPITENITSTSIPDTTQIVTQIESTIESTIETSIEGPIDETEEPDDGKASSLFSSYMFYYSFFLSFLLLFFSI